MYKVRAYNIFTDRLIEELKPIMEKRIAKHWGHYALDDADFNNAVAEKSFQKANEVWLMMCEDTRALYTEIYEAENKKSNWLNKGWIGGNSNE